MRDKTPPAAGPVNRDKMSFGQAFADARAKGEKTFPWRKGSYSTAKAGENPALDKGIARNAEQRSMAGQPGRDEAGKPGGGKGSAAPTTVKESVEINRMRFLAGLKD
jgi:hypothetical protein